MIELDFTALDTQPKGKTPKITQNSRIDELIQLVESDITLSDKATYSEKIAQNKAQMTADRNADIKNRALEVYKKYQDNSVKSEQLRAEVIKDIRAGADLKTILLTESKIISLLTNNQLFYDTIAELIK